MRFDVARLDAALQPIVGLRAWGFNWAADMLTMQLGPPQLRTIPFGRRKGQSDTVGQWALHVQTWEIAGWGIRVGNEASREQRDRTRGALGDDRLVERATADVHGGLQLVLGGSFLIRALPVGPVSLWDEGEYWRLFRAGDTSRHLVVTAAGIET